MAYPTAQAEGSGFTLLRWHNATHKTLTGVTASIPHAVPL